MKQKIRKIKRKVITLIPAELCNVFLIDLFTVYVIIFSIDFYLYLWAYSSYSLNEMIVQLPLSLNINKMNPDNLE